mgnify:CR=1 FL=1
MRFRRATAPKRRRIRKLRLLALLFVLGLLGLTSFSFGLLEAIATQIPALDPAREAQVQRNTDIYAADGHTILAVLRGSEARIVVPSSRISPWLKHAIVAIEDKRFYSHGGIDFFRAFGAAFANFRAGGVVQGFSTITMQLARNLFPERLDARDRGLTRKLREMKVARAIESRYSKDRILELYLNQIAFGSGAFGLVRVSLTVWSSTFSTDFRLGFTISLKNW